jgi:prophage tail gpP-like protein
MSRIIVKNATSGKKLLWRHIKIKKSLDDICHTLELEIPAGERAKIHRHEKIEARYENSLVKDSGGRRRVATVMVDEITAGADVSKHSVMIMGRSPARDIVDSAWGGDNDGFLLNNTLYRITKHICGKFKIACGIIPKDQGDITEPVAVFPGRTKAPGQNLLPRRTARALY